ncbi:MAG TPA: non-canonical purine NTP pyrophosphatase, partial [Gaiellaceae bacterium]|nr:non-canonical purine NTP pyrophosphatase [Gaiellaceae bacterium]
MDGLTARLASRNANKARELEHLLPDWRIEPLAADDYPAEDGTTYYENARGKALFGRTRAERDEWALGEDSGIEVAALGGRPGVQSARSGEDDPVGWLIGELAGVE